MESEAIDSFISRWSPSGGAERANYQLFLAELCTLLEVPPPDPTTDDDTQNAYVFERAVRFDNRDGTHSTGRIDKAGCFICETKTEVDEEILERLVALNHERAEEERRGLIRYLRPEFQNPTSTTQQTLLTTTDCNNF